MAIGRNEGDRLVRCLSSVAREKVPFVYVDSGSTDDSRNAALRLGADVVELDLSVPFTAARARNAGLWRLLEAYPDLTFVQFVDGDCEIRDGWLATARAFLAQAADIAVVCGRRRERHPEASVFNRLCDIEWNGPVGEILECGGDAMMRVEPLVAVGGYRTDLIAGEEPELCVRLRGAGWKIWRLGEEMTLHDAAMSRWTQWWNRSKRAGHAFAEVAWIHKGSPFAIWTRSVVSAVVWGGVLPGAVLILTLFDARFAGLVLVYPLQIARMAIRAGGHPDDWRFSAFTVLGKIPEFAGIVRYHLSRLLRRRKALIEYK
ncbi:MAG: glycosyltransferase family A protein [Burkholderiales bacterium]|nr:glycosyltransferase family A protein [Burkholderiales bacterium]